jgi:antitoxin ParD1/3/4
MNHAFPYQSELQASGGVLVQFVDVPEAHTSGPTEADAGGEQRIGYVSPQLRRVPPTAGGLDRSAAGIEFCFRRRAAMDIPLPRDLEELVRREVEAGAYASASEMVVEALYLLAARDRLLAGEQAALRREIELGIEDCERGEVVEADEVFARLRERLRRVKAPAK